MISLRRLTRFFACVLILVAASSGQWARSEVVYGNLGATGSGNLGSTNTDFGPSDSAEVSIAQGFTVGASATKLDVQSVTLGLFFDNFATASRTVSIYSSVSGSPGTSLFTSAPTTVGVNAKYTFDFSGVTLTPNTSYWLVPEGPASWYFNTPASSPVEQNSSGFTHLGTKKLGAISSSWSDADFSFYATSVVAVPEPSAIVLSGIGLASAMYAFRRRRG